MCPESSFDAAGYPVPTLHPDEYLSKIYSYRLRSRRWLRNQPVALFTVFHNAITNELLAIQLPRQDAILLLRAGGPEEIVEMLLETN